MKLKLVYKGNRIRLPVRIQNKLNNGFLEIEIITAIRSKFFVTYFTKGRRITIPKKCREALRLKNGQVITVEIKKVRNVQKPTKMLNGDSIDLLYFLLQKTMSGFPIYCKCCKDKIFLWYPARGRPKEIEFNRYVPKNFAKMLGYLQAEGGKPVLRRRRGREFSFTNKSLTLISDFLQLSKAFIDVSLFKATISINPKFKRIKKVESFLVKLGIPNKNIFIRRIGRVKEFTIKLWITNSLLAEFCYNAMNEIRKYLTKSNPDRDLLKFFLQGLLLGDGNVYCYKDESNSLHTRLQIFESNEQYIKDYEKILAHINVKGKIKKSKARNLFILTSYLNWHRLIELMQIFPKDSKQFNILICALKSHRKYRVLKHLITMNSKFTVLKLRSSIRRNRYFIMRLLKSMEKSNIVRGSAYIGIGRSM